MSCCRIDAPGHTPPPLPGRRRLELGNCEGEAADVFLLLWRSDLRDVLPSKFAEFKQVVSLSLKKGFGVRRYFIGRHHVVELCNLQADAQ
jgi:hypothetical protein